MASIGELQRTCSLSEGLASLREPHQEVTCSWRALASFSEPVRYSELLVA
ncbi:hypothetical protein A2U01_0045890 [Trifolium medium]|uniref:Uncharacterized protein n=1 Tax=Trifolium medium TaxID=97028 RepID=A0A392QLF8_9FABA|nr:hypothetical protein [Trifolium medium]